MNKSKTQTGERKAVKMIKPNNQNTNRNHSTTKVTKVAIYTRVSTTEQNLDLQVNDLTEYAIKRGWNLDPANIYQDTISGATKSRPSLDRLFQNAKQRKFDIVLVWKFDRFARSLKMLVDSLELFKDLGIDFVSYKESIDTTTSMGRLIFNINSAYAEFERELIGDRVKAGVANYRAKKMKIIEKESLKETIKNGGVEGNEENQNTNHKANLKEANTWGRRDTSPATQTKIHQLKQSGKSIRVIAKELKLSPSTVQKWLKG